MKLKKGISLIVLSITILVMAILAATTIISLENSGIIGRSKNTVTKQNKQEEYTRLQVIKNGILTDNFGEITIEEYVTELKNKGIIEETTTVDKYGSTVVKTKSGLDVYIKQDGNSNLQVSLEQIVVSTLGSMIESAKDYGKTVNYVSDNGVTGWKVFYKQVVDGEEYVYLIASEKLAYDKMPTDIPGTTLKLVTATPSDGITRNLGNIYWSTVQSSMATIQNPNMWLANWGNYDSYNTNKNGRCASYFLDETYWTEFKNTSANYSYGVIGAIGTPTLEMFVESWNAKRTATNNTTIYNKAVTLTQSGTTGYNINNGMFLTLTASDSLYVWSTIASNTSCWLASPLSRGVNYMAVIEADGTINYDEYSHYAYGIRPVVCLKASILANPGTTTDIAI